MQRLLIRGKNKLRGEVKIQGSKNSCLPIMAAALMCSGETVLHNCPKLSDIKAALDILKALGCDVLQSGNTIIIAAPDECGCRIDEALMLRMRSSIIFLGALLGKQHSAYMAYPGGCNLGARPIDLHISALERMGAVFIEDGCIIKAHADSLCGTNISLGFPSVGATENIILAAVTAKGETVIDNAAQEPEISDLSNFLNRCGAKIKGMGKSRIVIEGVERLNGCEYTIMPDRIVAATYLSAYAAAGGDITLKGAEPEDMTAFLQTIAKTGMILRISDNEINAKSCYVKAVDIIRTMPHPGFPTDAQPPLMAAMCVADGVSMIIENIFENRFMHAGELVRMGADIRCEGRAAVVYGCRLHGAAVKAPDLRGGAALVAAALAAEGETLISDIYHIDRGYEDIENNISLLGGDIIRI